MSGRKSTKLFPEANDNLSFNPGEKEAFEEYPDVDRPLKRGDCFNDATGEPIGPRPCPFITCKHNRFLFINSIGTAFADAGVSDPLEMPADRSCILDIVDRNEHGMIQADIAREFGFSSQQGANVLEAALRNAARSAKKLKIKIPKGSPDV